MRIVPVSFDLNNNCTINGKRYSALSLNFTCASRCVKAARKVAGGKAVSYWVSDDIEFCAVVVPR